MGSGGKGTFAPLLWGKPPLPCASYFAEASLSGPRSVDQSQKAGGIMAMWLVPLSPCPSLFSVPPLSPPCSTYSPPPPAHSCCKLPALGVLAGCWHTDSAAHCCWWPGCAVWCVWYCDSHRAGRAPGMCVLSVQHAVRLQLFFKHAFVSVH